MNILYIHGLNGSLSIEKQTILEQYGKVYAPTIDYENNPNSILWLYERYHTKKINAIIGSSMGGFAGYHLSKLLQLPVLLFNPALAQRTVFQNIPQTPECNANNIHIVLGARDRVVNSQDTLNYIGNGLNKSQTYSLSLRHDLEHRIPISVFEVEVSKFITYPNS